MIFGLLDRQDRLEVSIPFTTDNATWHITEKNNYMPYKAVLWRAENMGVPKKKLQDGCIRIVFTFISYGKILKGIEYFRTQTILMFKFSPLSMISNFSLP